MPGFEDSYSEYSEATSSANLTIPFDINMRVVYAGLELLKEARKPVSSKGYCSGPILSKD
jgi:hypothetical protein